VSNFQISDLIDALMCLPSVGARSAERMAYHLLINNRAQGMHLAKCLANVMEKVNHCERCNNFCTDAICNICQSTDRNGHQLCIVEMPLDLRAIESSAVFSGQYFVLMGRLSPLDGIGPAQLSIDKLICLCKAKHFKEIIFALNPSVEGEATIHYLRKRLQHFDVSFSQLARGVPMGGELSFLDPTTVERALTKRSIMADELS
jgi:recombination protein RecR